MGSKLKHIFNIQIRIKIIIKNKTYKAGAKKIFFERWQFNI